MNIILQMIADGFLSMIPRESMDYFVLIISILSTACIVSTSYIKNVKTILVLLATANLAIAISYFATGNYNGAVSCTLGALTAIISGVYDMKGKDIPLFVSVLYGVVFTIANLCAWEDWIPTGIVIVASLMFAISTVQKTGKMYRVWTVGNILLWITYDIIQKSGGTLVSHMITFTFMISGMILDVVRARKAKQQQQ